MYDSHQPPKQHYQYVAIPRCSLLASIIKFPPKGSSDSYKDLVCSEEDKANIFELITTLAENGKLSLLVKQSYLRNLGAQVNHVHPLKFLGIIFSNSNLKGCMKEVFDDYFKRTGFLEGLGSSLNREADKGKIEPYLKDFVSELKIPLEMVLPYFQTRDWENLVICLIGS